jgi:hypothetical protein
MTGISGGLIGSYAANVPNSYESIATVSLSGGNQSSISFTSIPNTYKHLQIRAIHKWNYDGNPQGSADYSSIGIRLNSDSGSNYTLHYLTGNGSTASGAASTPTAKGYLGVSSAPNGYSGYANIYGATVIDILDYTNTNKYKTVRSLSGFDGNGSGFVNLTSSLWQNTAAITNIEVLPDYPSWKQYSHFALYGIKG